ncbi:MAG: peptidase [Balneolaceae bacterium]|nr:MAG: peptidase [Balneolaceae bacterium]
MRNKTLNVLWCILLPVILICCTDNPADVDADPDENGPPDRSENLKPVGSSASDLLSGGSYTRLVVEITYVEGFSPTDNALNMVKGFLEARVNKPGGVVVTVNDPIPPPGNSTYTVQQIRELEEKYRRTYTEGTNISVHFLFLDKDFSQSSNVLGIAYLNTSMALFQNIIQNNSGGIGRPSRSVLERTVMKHELGHILGLVNIGSPMQTGHQDHANGAHCDNDQCLMYHAVNTIDFLATLTGGSVPQPDQNCIDDLRANGGK